MSTPAPAPTPPSFGALSFGGYLGQPGGLQGVSFWPRAAARLIDMAAHYAISLFGYFVLGMVITVAATLRGVPVNRLIARLGRTSVVAIVLSLLGAAIYETICEGVHGSTLGKRMLGMVVVQEDGSPCRIWPAFIRSLAYYVDSLFFGLIGYFAMQKTPQEQRHGDDWAHTVVCQRSTVAPENLRSGSRFALVLLFAAMADSALMMIGALFKIL